MVLKVGGNARPSQGVGGVMNFNECNVLDIKN